MFIINYLKTPLRLANHILIKIFNKKIKTLNHLKKEIHNKIGLEVGGPSKIFSKKGYMPIYQYAERVDGCNFSLHTVWEQEIVGGLTYVTDSKNVGYQYVKDASDLSVIKNDQYDFLLSSHSLEHIANPINALNEWVRVLKKGGIIIIIVPDRQHTFDKNREVTRFEHLLDDFNNNTQEDDLTHMEEIILKHDLKSDKYIKDLKSFEERCLYNYNNRCMHHHVFDIDLIKNIFEFCGVNEIYRETAPPYHQIIVGKKR